MRVFNQLVFSGYVTGTSAPVYSDEHYQDLLGQADLLSLSGYTAQVTGSSPTLTVRVQQSFDKFRWLDRNAHSTPEINNSTLQTGTTETVVQGHDGNGVQTWIFPRIAFVRLRIILAGTGAVSAQVRIWATGRDRRLG